MLRTLKRKQDVYKRQAGDLFEVKVQFSIIYTHTCARALILLFRFKNEIRYRAIPPAHALYYVIKLFLNINI